MLTKLKLHMSYFLYFVFFNIYQLLVYLYAYPPFFFFEGTTSLDGPGSLVHLGSLKCIHPSGGGTNVVEGNKLVIYAGCSESR